MLGMWLMLVVAYIVSKLSSDFGVIVQDITIEGSFYEKCFIGNHSQSFVNKMG